MVGRRDGDGVTLRFAVTEREPGRRGASAASATIAAELGFDELTAGRRGARRDRARDEPRQARHGDSAELVLSVGRSDGRATLDILSLDRGPGTDDMARWLRDGYSTAGSHGNGLGAVRRSADLVDVHSTAEAGTAILARFHGPRSDDTGRPVDRGRRPARAARGPERVR